MSTALATIETLTAVQVFVECDPAELIARLETEIRALPKPDMTVKAEREATRSLAAKITRTKTGLDELGKEFVAELKKQTGGVDAKRKLIRDRLDALKEEVREPLTSWEDAETARVDAHEKALVWIMECDRFATMPPTVPMLLAQIDDLSSISARNWQEFKDRADVAIEEATGKLTALRETAEQAERDAAELAELRRLKAEREEQDRIAAAAQAEAERKAREAEAVAKREALLVEQARRDAEAQAQAEIAKAAQAVRDAEAAAARAVEDERRRVAAIEAAAEAERQRLATVKAAEDAAERKRQENKKHRAKINNEALAVLGKIVPDQIIARLVIEAIARGNVPHVSITY